MPKAAAYALIWAAERGNYELYELGDRERPLLRGGDEAWFAWLESHAAFAFHGQSGHINLLKEARKGGAGYWYAYRRHGKRTVKRYAGRAAELTTVRLEALAGQLAAPGVPQTSPAQPEIPAPPLLAPKLQLPRLHPDLVIRERLLALLDAGLSRKLTLLCAPAGFGKTTLVRQWLASRSFELQVKSEELIRAGPTHNSVQAQYIVPLPPNPQLLTLNSQLSTLNYGVAWLSLDPGDNDPIRFWRYVITACRPFLADRGQEVLGLLAAAAQPLFEAPAIEIVLTTFLNQLTSHSEGGILVLEDYHAITAPQIHATMTFLLEHLPATLHLIVLARSDPPLPLARLRARGDLHEVGTADLRFSQEETRRFFTQTLALPLSPEAGRQLDRRLEGWAAGLRLLALALQGRAAAPAIETILATLAGSHRPILEYFVAEVLGTQPEATQAFLLQTSVLGRLNSSLCAAVTGRQDSGQLLAALDRANLFLEPLDGVGQWYRYHALFAEAMQHEAHRRFGETALPGLARAASAWYEQHGLPAEAIEAALQARDWEHTAVLIARLIEMPSYVYDLQRFNEPQEFHTLRRWLEQLPDSVLRQHPLLCLYYAIALLFSSPSEYLAPAIEALVDRALNDAETGLRAIGNIPRLGEVLAYRAFFCEQRGEIEAALVYARQGLDWLPADSATWRTLCLSRMGIYEAFAGQYHKAQQTLLASQALNETVGNRTLHRAHVGMRAAVQVEQGMLAEAAAKYRQNLAEARDQGDREDICHALLGLANLAYEWNDLETPLQYASEVLSMGEHLAHEEFQVHAAIMLARVQQARGQTAPAQQRLATMLIRLQPRVSPRLYRLQRELLAWQARLALLAGDLAAVQRWAAGRENGVAISRVQYELEESLLARLLIAQDAPEHALDRLAGLLPAAQEEGRVRGGLEMQTISALAYAASDRQAEARPAIRAVLAAAQTERYVRLFLDEGAPMMALLNQSIDRRAPADPLRGYVERLLAAFRAGSLAPSQPLPLDHPSALAEPLSPQEQRVLRLLAAGRSNSEIARELVVSVNTIRTHVQSIYRKLDVSNRVAAGEVARHLRLV